MTPKQKKIALAVGGGIVVLCIIASCSRRTDYAYAPQPQVLAQAPQVVAAPAVAPAVVAAPPVIVNQAPAHDGFFTGMLMGHLMSGGGGSRVEHHYNNAPAAAAPAQNVTKNVTINKTYVQPAAPVAPAAVAQKPSYTAPTTVYRSPVASVPTYSAPKATSYSGSYSPRSSYSSSYSSSSSYRSSSYGRR